MGTTHALHPLFPKVPPAETPIYTKLLPTTTDAIIPLVQCPQLDERQSGTNGPQPHQSPSMASTPNGPKPRQRPTTPVTAGSEATADSGSLEVEARLISRLARSRASLCFARVVLR